MRSAFAESTTNRLLLLDGEFRQSDRETVLVALAPFDAFLVTLVGKLNFHTPMDLPTEEQLERDTNFSGKDQVILVSELLDCGFLVLDDRPGELPRYTLDGAFDWDGRFKLFPRAHAAWAAKLRSRRAPRASDLDEDEFDWEAPDGRGIRRDRLPDADGDEYIDFAELDKVIRKAEADAAQRRLEHPRKPKGSTTRTKEDIEPVTVLIEKPQKAEQAQVDVFLAKLLTMAAGGRSFSAPDWKTMVAGVADATTTPAQIAKLGIDPTGHHAKVFVVALRDGQCVLSINPMLSWDMLLSYPKTRAICDKLLEGG